MEEDLILHGGRVHTMDASNPAAAAVVIRGGRIQFAGRDEDALGGRGGRRINLGGRSVIPGLTDCHVHLAWYAESLAAVDAGASTLDEALQRVAERARAAAPGQWITGSGWDGNLWSAPPARGHLDAAAPGHPVVLWAKSGHALWVSTLALKAAGITGETPDPRGGRILRDAGGATGILLENAMQLVLDHIPLPSAEELADLLIHAQETMHVAGLAGVHDFDPLRVFTSLRLLERSGKLGLRVMKGIPRGHLSDAAGMGLRAGAGESLLTPGPLKLFADGALGPQSAWMLEPYEGSSSRGIPTLSAEELLEEIRGAGRAGLPCAVHAIGDAACRAALDAFERAGEEARREGRAPGGLRNRIEHLQLLHPRDLPRLAALGVIASMQPLHATSDMLIAEKHWGARCSGAYAWRSLIDAGAALAFGSDCPVENPSPLAGIHAAVTRRRGDGSPGPEGWRPQQRLTVHEAVRAYTLGAAFAAGRESELGSLEAGKRADLTILDRDIFTVDPAAMPETRVEAVMLDGQFVFRRF